MKRRAVLALSGGMDSTSLLIHLLANGYEVRAFSFDYGQKHGVELQRARDNIYYLQSQGYEVLWKSVDLRSVLSGLKSALLTPNIEVPEGHYEQENMIQTVVPNRNAILSSIIYAHALSWGSEVKSPVVISLGIHAGDHAIYPDCRPEFRNALAYAFQIGNWGSEYVSYYTPYLTGNKTTILQDCLVNCERLGIDFDTVLKNTNTSYNPDLTGRASGKSGADIERIEAFLNIGRVDPAQYQQPWEEVVAHAKSVLNIS